MTLLWLMLSIDLRYCSIVLRLLDARTLLVTIEMSPMHGQIYSAYRLDLIFFKKVLIKCT